MLLCNTADPRRPSDLPGDRKLYSGYHGETRNNNSRVIINGRVISYGEASGPSRRPIADLGLDSNKVPRGFEGPLLHQTESCATRLSVQEQMRYRLAQSEFAACGERGAEAYSHYEQHIPFYREDCPEFYDAAARMKGAQVPDYVPHLPQPYAVGLGRRYGFAPHLVHELEYDPNRPAPIERLDRPGPQNAPRAAPVAARERGDRFVRDLSTPNPLHGVKGRGCGALCIPREPGDYGGK